MGAPLPVSATRYDPIPLKGGLDLLTPLSGLKPGVVRDALNFECSVTGGYTLSGRYERFDGRPSPSAAQYSTLTVVAGGALAVGATVTGATSGATGRIIDIDGSVVAFTKAGGAFVSGEAIQVGGSPAGTITSLGGSGTAASYDARCRALAANVWRADILAVPGSGPVRGVAMLGGTLYAWRDNAGATALAIWRQTSGGWASVSLGGAVVAPGGRVQTDVGNFSGVTCLYGCDGVNKGFQFDGTTYTQITTGNIPDTPDNVLVHRDHLWFGFGTNLQNSGIAAPLMWTALSGSASYRLAAPITVLMRQPGNQASGVMLVATLASTSLMYGSSAADFRLVDFEESAGARKYGAQNVAGQALLFGDTGIFSLAATQAYGNFEAATLTMNIRPWTQTRRTRCTASLVSREKSQYRAFFSDGFALYTTVVNGKLLGSMPQYFANKVTCACRGDAWDGVESAYFGSDNGFVYQLDVGTSQDGAPIVGYFALTYAGQGNTEILKRYRGLSAEVQGESYVEFGLSYSVSYGGTDRAGGGLPVAAALPLADAHWDSSAIPWDSSRVWWDAHALSPTQVRIDATGQNIALRVDVSSDMFLPFTVNSLMLKFSPRKAAKA